MTLKLQIANGFYESNSLPLANQECVNMYPNLPQTQGALNAESLFQSPGISEFVSGEIVGDSSRGSAEMDGLGYFVAGTTLYRLNSDGSKTSLGTIEGTGLVWMPDNGTQLMILVPGIIGYIYTVAAGLAEITDADFFANGNPQTTVFIDSYFMCSTDTKKYIISANNDGTAWNALDFGTAESDPDVIVAIAVSGNQAYILGSTTTEGVQNIGSTITSLFPFRRSGLFLDKGCSAPFSVVNSSGSFFMVGKGAKESPAIWQFTGNNYQKISSTAIDTYISSLPQAEVEVAFAMAYAIDGAYFIAFSFPETTFEYNLVTKKWHERKSIVEENEQRWRVNTILTSYGKTFAGDSFDDRIGVLDPNIYSEYDNDIIKIFTCQVFDDGGIPFSLSRIELTIESGTGTLDILGDDIERTLVVESGTATIDGDDISFTDDAGVTVVKEEDYFEVGQLYEINCTVTNYSESIPGTSSIFLPYSGTGISGADYDITADGTYQYDHEASGVKLQITSLLAEGDVTINYIKPKTIGIEDPECSMSVSRDGKTFDFERARSMGKEGEFDKRQIWRGLGNFKRFGILRFRFSESVKTVIIKLEVE